MTAEITSEQAKLITDLPSYFRVTGARRFKRTKDEMLRGLAPANALAERLKGFQGASEQESSPPGDKEVIKRPRKRRSKKSDGEIVIRIRPGDDVDPDYLETLPSGEVVVEQSNGFYAWIYTKLEVPYDGDASRLFTDILDEGIGEVIVRKNFEADL